MTAKQSQISENATVDDRRSGNAKRLAKSLSSIKQSLRKISEGAVTQVALGQAVREELINLLDTQKKHLFPELGETKSEIKSLEVRIQEQEKLNLKSNDDLNARIVDLGHATASDVNYLKAQLENFKGSIVEKIETLQNEIEFLRREFQERSNNIQENLGKLEVDLTHSFNGSLTEQFGNSVKEFESKLEQGIGTESKRLETMIEIEALVRGEALEAEAKHRKEATEAAISRDEELKSHITFTRQEIMNKLEDKLDGLMKLVLDLSERFPSKESIAKVDERLERVEEDFKNLASYISVSGEGGLDMEGVREKLNNVHNLLDVVNEKFSNRENQEQDTKDQFSQNLDRVKSLLQESLQRRDMKRSLVQRRILELRDTLREKLDSLIENSPGNKNTTSRIWDKVSGKESGIKRLSNEELSQFRQILEDVLEGLEFLIFENRVNDGVVG